MSRVVIVMGVSGSGKSTVGEALARRLAWDFQEGDDFHPPANIRRMQAGHALTDADRAPWLARIGQWIDDELAAGRSGVITCSALKRAYRDRLVAGRAAVRLLYLEVPASVLSTRLAARQAHFMPAALLGTQLAALEPPAPEEHAIIAHPEDSMDAILGRLRAAISPAASG